MIKIDINSNHVADISDDLELKGCNCEVQIGGDFNEIRHELRVLLKAMEVKESIYHIWLEELADWSEKRCEEHEHTST